MARITPLPSRLSGSRLTAAHNCLRLCRQGHYGAAPSLVSLVAEHAEFQRQPDRFLRRLDPTLSVAELLAYFIAKACCDQHGFGHNCLTPVELANARELAS